MARTHAQRRRQNVLLTLALVVTLVVLLFARDVSRAAHSSSSIRRSENRSFGLLANSLLAQENTLDQRLAYLLVNGGSLPRPVFAARLDQLAQGLPQWSSEATLLRRPELSHDVNTVFAQLTEQRVDDYQRVVDAVASSLSLPWKQLNTTGLSVSAALASLLATDQQWQGARWSLVREPGRVRLDATSTSSVLVTLPTTLASLASAPSLAVSRGIGITAVALSPPSLPAAAGQLVLPPVTSVHLGVTVTNASYVRQPVALTVTLTPANPAALAQTRRMTVTLGPLDSYAFVPPPLSTTAGEHATLTLSLSGAPAGVGMSLTRTYRVTLSPSGTG